MAYTLSNGSLEIIINGGVYEKPVIQILGIQKIEQSGVNERFRLQVSDGKHFHSFAILATQLNNKVYSGELSLFSVVQINVFKTTLLRNTNKEERMIIILDILIIARGTEVGRRLGNPQLWTNASASAAPVPIPATPPPTASHASVSTTPKHLTDAASHASTDTKPNPLPSTASHACTSTTPKHSAGTSFNSTTVDSKLTIPIANLTPYQNKWCIKARVVNKTEIKSYKTAKTGKYFKVDLCDDSGEIGATAFNNECDKFYDKIESDKVYYISSCQIKTANKQFYKLNNDYEMIFKSDTLIAECFDNDSTLPTVKYDFLPISDIANKRPDTILDVIGVCKMASDLQEFTAKNTGRLLKKREVTLVDQSSAITLALWGNDAEKFDASTNPVIAVKGARLAEFNGSKSLSCLGSTMLRTNPDLPDAHRLRGWYDHGGASAELVNVSARVVGSSGGKTEWITFKEAETRRTGSLEKGDYYNLLGVLIYTFADNAVYKACPQDSCNRKVLDQENGLFRCEKCDREYTNFKYRLILGGTIADPTGDRKITAFNEVAESMLGKSAEEVGHLLENDKEEYGRLFDEINLKTFLFNLRSKAETYNNEQRVQTIVMSAQPINYKDANSRFVKSIKTLSGIQV
ncbi:replication protein A 70 kDa DNA-binding subunit-like [Nymphalis io]|uniref:replication protein A 70 kDa DNA-binding subunit-like n=1 Tax=Inachis io TaxID=171585 RepID=UPI0021688AF5|nr:replication protein A 70 kDa DNA-binding subunit-like [Nymphalis io]